MSRKQQPVLAYLEALHAVRGTGKATEEQSYKSKLEALLTAAGETFDPRLFATMELKQEGAGQPDLGIFEKKSGNLRLVVEAKPARDDIYDTARGEQVSRYWRRYGFVLVTNFREFVLVARNTATDQAVIEARYRLAPSSEVFWRTKAATLAKDHERGLTDFLHGVFARPAPILKPKDLAADLARHAREAKRRLGRHSAEALRPLQEAFESALGLTFDDKKGLDFFRSSLVQTLFYGLFSGWMLWRQTLPKGTKPPPFDWKDASDFLALPLIGDLFDEVAKPKRLTELDLREPLEWAAASLNRVNHAEFFKSFDADHAITLFYEPFLEAFDPALRKELGVWYTPPEIVRYMVERVDQLLRSELGIGDGLADDSVYVLDPATGTGSYLVEVARRIHRTLEENGTGALTAAGVKKALTTRVFGFELLPAPYVVAHLQLGVLLTSLGSGLTGKERTGVYLTNALTGWEPPKGAKAASAFKFLTDEQDAAATVKRNKPIIVILGNPPYNGFAGVVPQEEKGLIQPYYDGIEEFDVQIRSLNDLYVRFYRLAERRLGRPNHGIVSFISNFGWLDGQSYPVMRRRMLEHFDQLWIDNCNGDKFRTGKTTPDGRPDQSMFTTDEQPEGIQPGTAIVTAVRVRPGSGKEGIAHVLYRDLWGLSADKRAALVRSLAAKHPRNDYDTLTPVRALRYILTPGTTSMAYSSWPRLPEVFAEYYTGVKTSRDEFLVDVDKARLEERLRKYFDATVSDADIAAEFPTAMADATRFEGQATRRSLVLRGMLPGRVVKFSYRPLDDRWLFWEPEGKLLDEKRADYAAQVWADNIAFTAAAAIRKGRVEGPLPLVHLGCIHLIERTANVFTLYQRSELAGGRVRPCVADSVLAALCSAKGKEYLDSDGHSFTKAADETARAVFFHTLAVLWSPAYRKENEAALRQDWPRVPIPADPERLGTSADLGRQLADLLLPDQQVPGVTKGKIRAPFGTLAIPTKPGHKTIDPDKDLEVTATWGFRGQGNAVMAGKGKVTPNESDPQGAVDVWINDAVCWRNIPIPVWEMTIGGYPVVKKWLSYREKRVLGRALKMDEVLYVTEMVRRLAAVLALGGELDANYAACAAATLPLGAAFSASKGA